MRSPEPITTETEYEAPLPRPDDAEGARAQGCYCSRYAPRHSWPCPWAGGVRIDAPTAAHAARHLNHEVAE